VEQRCLAGHPRLALRRQVTERAHVVQPVRQFDDHHPDVVDHGEDHFTQVLGLFLVEVRVIYSALGLDALELADALHQGGDRIPKGLGQIVPRCGRVLYDVMQQRGNHRVLIHPQIQQDDGHFEWVYEIRLAGGAQLFAVCFSGVGDGMSNPLDCARE